MPRLALGGVTQTWPDQLIQHSITCSKRKVTEVSMLDITINGHGHVDIICMQIALLIMTT